MMPDHRMTLMEAAQKIGQSPPVSEGDLYKLAAVLERAGVQTNMDDEPSFAALRNEARINLQYEMLRRLHSLEESVSALENQLEEAQRQIDQPDWRQRR